MGHQNDPCRRLRVGEPEINRLFYGTHHHSESSRLGNPLARNPSRKQKQALRKKVEESIKSHQILIGDIISDVEKHAICQAQATNDGFMESLAHIYDGCSSVLSRREKGLARFSSGECKQIPGLGMRIVVNGPKNIAQVVSIAANHKRHGVISNLIWEFFESTETHDDKAEMMRRHKWDVAALKERVVENEELAKDL